ncbi:MAG: NAD(P)-dependent oxidoreductase [bacterium]|nr:NAD(P)-dependent oxidoreductase [bacterium]
MSLPPEYAQLAGRRIFVTGAAGFIGGALLRRLAGYGLDVTGSVLEPREVERLRSQGYRAVLLDLASDGPWDELLAGVDVVFHVAALFQEVDASDEAYELVNHRAALELARAAERCGVTRFVHCSTVGVHGHVKEIPATERTPFNPMDVYHKTKLAGEVAILEFGRSLSADGMVVTVNRPAMVYGPGDLRMLKLFRSILSGRFRMIGSGRTLAHLGYIEDQTESFLLQAVAPRDRVHGEAFNIASGEPLTLNEVAASIADAGGVRLSKLRIPLAPVYAAAVVCEAVCRPLGIRPPLFPRRVGFFSHDRAFDLTKAAQRLGYESRWDHVRGIAATIAWYRERGLIPAESGEGRRRRSGTAAQ